VKFANIFIDTNTQLPTRKNRLDVCKKACFRPNDFYNISVHFYTSFKSMREMIFVLFQLLHSVHMMQTHLKAR